MIGLRLGPWRIVEKAGEGGVGSVYRAEDASRPHDGPVALKVLADRRLAEPQMIARFRREAKVLAALDHPAICGFRDFGEAEIREGGRPHRVLYLVLEWVEGRDLSAILAERERLGIEETVRLGLQVAVALEVAHAAGVVHRDLKPGNLRITSAGDLKILDFGLAKILAESRFSREGLATFETSAGAVLGSARHMAPEQLLGRAVDERTDLYSLGSVLYRCLTGRDPCQGRSLLAVLRSVTEEVPPSVRSLRPDVPDLMAEVVDRLLAKNPLDRPGSAAEVASRLRNGPV